MAYKKLSCIVFVVTMFLTVSIFPGHANDIVTEVILTVQDDEILAFSAYKNHWVSEDVRLTERVVGKKSKGNIGVVITTKRILGFSVLTDQWTTENLKINEIIEEIKVEGNVAIMNTDQRVIGFSAHTGQWTEAP